MSRAHKYIFTLFTLVTYVSMMSVKMTSQHELLDFPGCNIMLSVKIHGYNIAFFVTKPPSWVKKAY